MENQPSAKLKAQFNLFAMVVPCQFVFEGHLFLIKINQSNDRTFEPEDFLNQFLMTGFHSLQFSTSTEVFNLSGKVQIETEDKKICQIKFKADSSEDFQNYLGTHHEHP